MDLRTASSYFIYFVICASFLLTVKLGLSGLWRVYKFFTLYIAFRAVVGLIGAFIGSRHGPEAVKAEAWLYVCSESMSWLLQFLTLLEIYTLVLKRFPGIATLGRRCLSGALVLSVTLSGLTLALNLQPKGPPFLEDFFVFYRFVSCSLLLFVVLIIVFLVWFPVSLNRNTVLHCAVFAVYFFSKTLILLISNIQGVQATVTINLVIAALASACLLVWIVFLKPAGEAIPVKTGRGSSPQDEERLLRQLDAINDTLVSASRK